MFTSLTNLLQWVVRPATILTLPLQGDWTLMVYIDDKAVALLSQLPALSQNAILQFSVWNQDGWVQELDPDDVFYVPKTDAFVRNIM